MDQNEKKPKNKPEVRSRALGGCLWRDVEPLPSEELKEVPDEARLIALIMLIKLIEELMGAEPNRTADVVASLH